MKHTQNHEIRTCLHFLCHGKNMNHELLNSHYRLKTTVSDHCWPSSGVAVWSLSRQTQFASSGSLCGIRTPLLFGRAAIEKSTSDRQNPKSSRTGTDPKVAGTYYFLHTVQSFIQTKTKTFCVKQHNITLCLLFPKIKKIKK